MQFQLQERWCCRKTGGL